MIAIVCGGRDYANAERVTRVLDAAVDRLGLHTIIEGGAKGADELAGAWAKARGDISLIEVPADWSQGKGAGLARNNLMMAIMQRGDGSPADLELERAVIAFPGGTGTD